MKFTMKGRPPRVTRKEWAKAQVLVQQWFEKEAEHRHLIKYSRFLTGLGIEPARRGTKEYEAGGIALRALYSLDISRHEEGLPIFSVLLEFKDGPPPALLKLLRELGLIRLGQPMNEILDVIERERYRTWDHYGEGLF